MKPTDPKGIPLTGNKTMFIAGAHYSIPKEPGRNTSLLMAALMHVLLFVFLWVGIRWQSTEPIGVDAEVWDMSTREAAPLPTPSVPPPVVEQPPQPDPAAKQLEQQQQQDAEIAIERAKEKQRLENKRAEAEKARLLTEQQHKQELEDQKRKADAAKEQQALKTKQDAAKVDQQAKLDALKTAALDKKQRDDNLKRMTGSGGSGDAVKSTGNNRVDPSYAGKIAAKIKSNMTYLGADNGSDNPTVEFRIDLFPDGSLRGAAHKTKSSGVAAFDDAVERAITKSAPYPADKSGNVPPTIPLTYRLKD